MFKNINLISKSKRTNDKEAFEYYREHSKKRNPKNIKHYTQYSSVLCKIYEKIRKASLDYEAGVYAKNFFYLIPQRLPKKVAAITMENGVRKVKFNLHSNEHTYTLMYINLFKSILHRFWTMDGKFSKKYRHLASLKFKEGKNYIFSLSTLLKSRI